MAGNLRKDVELIFRGEDRASPTIKSVRKNVGDLTSAIQEQLDAAAKGEGSIDDLAKAYASLKEAQGDVGEITKLASAHETLTKKLAEQAKAVEAARTKEAALAAQIEAAERPTQRLVNSRDAAARAVTAAVSKEAELQAAVQASSATLEAAGLDAKNFAHAQDQIRQAALETARALRDAAAAKESFGSAQASGKANIAASDEMAAFNKMAAGSGLPQAQIAFISTLENRLHALRSAIAEDQASMAGLNRELQDRSAQDAAQRVRVMAAALDEADQAAERLKSAATFRSFAAEIEAGARNVSRFGPQLDNAATSGRRLAEAVNAILNPTNEAVRTISGVNGVLEQSETVLDGSKRRMSEYNAEINHLQAAMAGLHDMARLVDDFRRQEAATAAATAEFEAAQTQVLALARDIKQAEAPTQEMANALSKAEGNLEKAGSAMQRETTKLTQLDAAMKKAGIDTRNLVGAEEQLVVAANRAAAAQGKLQGKTGGSGAFLGLKPYEIQNLGYQINDIVVSLISGQKPMTVFVQQGAQIGQIIPGAFSKIVRFAPELLALVAVIAVLGSAMKKAGDDAEHLREGAALVAQFGGDSSGVSTTAKQYGILAEQLDRAGVAADKTKEILAKLASDGLDAAAMQQYIETAKNLSKITGDDIPTSIDKLREGFQGGAEDILKLSGETIRFTDDEVALIQKLFEHGQADEARATALEIYSAKAAQVANQQMGPWSRAADLLRQAWDNMLKSISNWRPFQEVLRYFHEVAIGAAYIAARLAGYSHEEAGKRAVGQIPTGPAGGGQRQAHPADPNRRTTAGRTMEAEDRLDTLKATAADGAAGRAQRREVAVLQARNEAQEKGLSNLEVELHVKAKLAQFNATEDQKQDKRDTAAGKRAAAAERRRQAAARAAARRAQAEQNRLDNQSESILRGVESLDSSVEKKSTDTLESRLKAIDSQYAKLLRDLDDYEAKTKGLGKVGDMTIAQARTHILAQEQQLKNYAALDFYEARLNDLVKTRGEKLDEIKDRVGRGIITPEQGLAESDQVINDMAAKIEQMAKDGLAFAISLRTATPNPALEAMIAKMQTAIQNNSAGQNVVLSGKNRMEAVTAEQQKLNQIIERRNALVQNENTLVQLGLIGRREAQARIAQHYKDTKGLINDQIQGVLALGSAFENGTDEQKLFYKALQAEMATTSVEAGYVDARFVELKQNVDSLLTSNIVGFIDAVAQAFAKLATQQSSVIGFLGAIGVAFLDMIAKTLQGIAMLIIQMIVLDAVDKLTGGILKPLLKLYGSVPVHHEGGVVGSGNRSRNINPAVFANAPRYHTGGIAGLAPDERAAILRKNEEVLTEADPRHRFNGGLAPPPSSGQNMRAVLAVGDDQIAEAMASSAGEKVVLFHLRRNKTGVKQMLDS